MFKLRGSRCNSVRKYRAFRISVFRSAELFNAWKSLSRTWSTCTRRVAKRRGRARKSVAKVVAAKGLKVLGFVLQVQSFDVGRIWGIGLGAWA